MSENMKILIGYDGSDCADRALIDLQRAGLPVQAQALMISVAESWLPVPAPSSYEIVGAAISGAVLPGIAKPGYDISLATERAHDLAFQASKAVRNRFPHWDVHSEAYHGSPATVLIEKADEWGADLIVIGSHGHTATGWLFLGSTAQKVANEASVSVRIANGRSADKVSPVRILIGVDGSAGSEAAVRAVASRQWPVDSEVRLVTATNHHLRFASEQIEEYAVAQAIQEMAIDRLNLVGLEVSSVIKEEDPKRLLVAEADLWGADSIFIGAGRHNRFSQCLLGSVSTAVVSRASCSVEVARVRHAE